MIVEVTEYAGHVSALGHKVSLEQGGHAELKRRCLETLCRLKEPPDEIRFQRAADDRAAEDAAAEPDAEAPRSALLPPPPDPPLSAPFVGSPVAPRALPPTDPATPRAKRRLGR